TTGLLRASGHITGTLTEDLVQGTVQRGSHSHIRAVGNQHPGQLRIAVLPLLLDVDGFDVNESVGDRQRQQVRVDDLHVRCRQRPTYLGILRVALEPVLYLDRPLDLVLPCRGQLQHRELTVVLRVRGDRHERRQRLPLERGQNTGELERRLVLAGQFGEQVVRWLPRARGTLRLLALLGRIRRHIPEHTVVELFRRIDMVLTDDLPLNIEYVRRIAEVAPQLVGDLRLRLDHSGEDVHPCLQHRIIRIDRVQRDLTRVRVHGRLHRVPDVVDGTVLQLGDTLTRVLRCLAQLRAL